MAKKDENKKEEKKEESKGCAARCFKHDGKRYEIGDSIPSEVQKKIKKELVK